MRPGGPIEQNRFSLNTLWEIPLLTQEITWDVLTLPGSFEILQRGNQLRGIRVSKSFFAFFQLDLMHQSTRQFH